MFVAVERVQLHQERPAAGLLRADDPSARRSVDRTTAEHGRGARDRLITMSPASSLGPVPVVAFRVLTRGNGATSRQ